MRKTATLDGVEYAVGGKFRVIRDGASLSGWTPTRGGHRGWSRDLQVGDVVECAGFGPGWGSDPGYGIEFKAPGVSSVEVRPSAGSMWSYRPADGFLEPVAADTAVTVA